MNILSDKIQASLDKTLEQTENPAPNERLAAHAALMRLGINGNADASQLVYTLVRLSNYPHSAEDLETSLKMDYAELISIAGKLYPGEAGTGTNTVVKTIMFRDMQIWANGDSYWKYCNDSYNSLASRAKAVNRLFIYDAANWFRADWKTLSTEEVREFREDAVGFLLGVQGHQNKEWPWKAVSLEQALASSAARRLFTDEPLKPVANTKRTGSSTAVPQLYYASAALGDDTVLYIHRYRKNQAEESKERAEIPELYWLKFFQRQASTASEFGQAFNRLWRGKSADLVSIRDMLHESPNRSEIESSLAAKLTGFSPEWQPHGALIPGEEKMVFLSAADEDNELARKLARDLESRGVDVWYWKDGKVPPGENVSTYPSRIVKTMASKFLFCMSSRSVGRNDSGVWPELKEAKKRQARLGPNAPRFILPVKFDPCEVPEELIEFGVSLPDLMYVELYPTESQWWAGVDSLVKAINNDGSS